MKHNFFASFSVALGFVLFSVWPLSVSAAVNYSRSPTGSSPASPVTVSVSVSGFFEYGLPPETRVYRLSLDTDFEGTPIGKCYPVSTLSISQTFILPAGGEVKGIGIDSAVGSGDLNDCDTGTTGFKYLEGEGTSVIFTAAGEGATVSAAAAATNDLETIRQLKIQILELQIKILELQIKALLGV